MNIIVGFFSIMPKNYSDLFRKYLIPEKIVEIKKTLPRHKHCEDFIMIFLVAIILVKKEH